MQVDLLGKPRQNSVVSNPRSPSYMKPFPLLLPYSTKPTPKSPLFTQSRAAANPSFTNSFFDDDGDVSSGVYEPRRQIPVPVNSASFIGSVTHPLRVANTAYGGSFGVHTFLKVTTSPQSQGTFRSFGSYSKNVLDGKSTLCHKLNVKELNFVAQDGQGPRSEFHEQPQSNGGEAGLNKYSERLHLWQVFFSNPHDWWDNRKRKLNPRQPDFKHKHMDEALWLSPDNPPWIKTQLHRLDLRTAEQGHGEQLGHHRRISKWEYDE